MTNKTIIINDYKKYWITDSDQGSIIKICHDNDDSVLTLDLRWKDRKRENNGRITNKKGKNV